jgi:hypothetical protein
MPHALGRAYVCTAIGHSPERTVYVTDRAAVPAVHRILRDIPGASSTTAVRIGSRRLSQTTLYALRDRIQREIDGDPRLRSDVDVVVMRGSSTDGCHRLSIGVSHKRYGRRWARSVVARYGADRVFVEQIHPTAP